MPDEAPLPTEEAIPELAITAFRQAFLAARRSGEPVVVADKGIVFEIQPDGTRQEIKTLPPHIPATIGAMISLR
jgi:hypothetical protein